MFLDPNKLDDRQMRVVDDWLVANGCRYHVAELPVVVARSRVHFWSICRRNEKAVQRLKVGRQVIDKIELLPDGSYQVHDRIVGADWPVRRQLRIRVPVAVLFAGLNSEGGP